MRLNAIDTIGSALACLIFPRTPRTATSTLLMISKLILVLILFITLLYFSLVLAAQIFSATLFRKRIASGAIPPVVVKARGEKAWYKKDDVEIAPDPKTVGVEYSCTRLCI